MKNKIIIMALLMTTLSACSAIDNFKKRFMPSSNKVIVEDRREVDAIVREQSTFKWKPSSEQIANTDTMLTAEKKDALEMLIANGGELVLYFDYDTATMSPTVNQKIMKHIIFMRDNPNIRLRLEGHTDERGTREYNLALGENRALSVKQALGFYNRIETVSYGEEKIQSSEDDKNRRVEFIYK